jgi:hypothetical protein
VIVFYMGGGRGLALQVFGQAQAGQAQGADAQEAAAAHPVAIPRRGSEQFNHRSSL